MEAVEKSDLHASAVQIVRVNNFAAITALWKKAGFGQVDSCFAPNPGVFASASNMFGSAGIFFKRQLRDLYVFPIARIAYDFLLHRLDTGCPPALFGRGCSAFLRGASRPAPSF